MYLYLYLSIPHTEGGSCEVDGSDGINQQNCYYWLISEFYWVLMNFEYLHN